MHITTTKADRKIKSRKVLLTHTQSADQCGFDCVECPQSSAGRLCAPKWDMGQCCANRYVFLFGCLIRACVCMCVCCGVSACVHVFATTARLTNTAYIFACIHSYSLHWCELSKSCASTCGCNVGSVYCAATQRYMVTQAHTYTHTHTPTYTLQHNITSPDSTTKTHFYIQQQNINLL